MKNLAMILSLSLSVLLGCASSTPKEKQLLPDAGPTTAEIMQGTKVTHTYYGNGQRSPYIGETLMPHYSSQSYYSSEHIQELKRDFKRVPNPEIVGYVYPHINNNEMPVPGYFTSFPLYNRNHFALTSEGYNE